MARLVRTWMWICLALLLTTGATYCEFQSVGAAFTAGDVSGPDQQEDQRAIRELEHQSDVKKIEAAVFLVFGSVCLGAGLRRRYTSLPVSSVRRSFSDLPGGFSARLNYVRLCVNTWNLSSSSVSTGILTSLLGTRKTAKLEIHSDLNSIGIRSGRRARCGSRIVPL